MQRTQQSRTCFSILTRGLASLAFLAAGALPARAADSLPWHMPDLEERPVMAPKSAAPGDTQEKADPNNPPLQLPADTTLSFQPLREGRTKGGREYQIAYEPRKRLILVTLKNKDGSWREETIDWAEMKSMPGATGKLTMDLKMLYDIRLLTKTTEKLMDEAERMERNPPKRAPVKFASQPAAAGSQRAGQEGFCFEMGPKGKVIPCSKTTISRQQ